MSAVPAKPELLEAAATDLAAIGSTLDAAHAAAPTLCVLPLPQTNGGCPRPSPPPAFAEIECVYTLRGVSCAWCQRRDDVARRPSARGSVAP